MLIKRVFIEALYVKTFLPDYLPLILENNVVGKNTDLYMDPKPRQKINY